MLLIPFKRIILLPVIMSLGLISYSQSINPADLLDVKHILLELQFDWKNKQAFGSASITFSVQRPSNTIALDAAKMKIEQIVDAVGRPIEFSYDGSENYENLKVNFANTLIPEKNILLKIIYRTNWVNTPDPNQLGGSTGKGLRFFQPSTTEPRKRKQVWSMAEFDANRYWFPCHEVTEDFYTSELIATVDTPLTVISNGDLLYGKINKDGRQTFHWKMMVPHAHHQTSVVVGEYNQLTTVFKGVPIHTYAYPDEVKATKASVIQLPHMIDFLDLRTGHPFPFSRYSQVFVQDLPWGMANTMASTLTENMVDDDRTHADFFYLWDDLESEAVAQQWFGNYITPVSWRESWLSRGFSRYFSELYDGKANGVDEVQLFPHQWDLSTYFFDWNNGNRHPMVVDKYENIHSFVTDNCGVFKGALVLNLLHFQLGDQLWWKVVKQYVKDYGGKTVSTKSLEETIEKVTKQKIHWFFDQWVYKMGHPKFEVSTQYEKGKLCLNIKQTQRPDTATGYKQTTYFQGKIDIVLDKKIYKVFLKPQLINSFCFSSSVEPKIIHLDPNDHWIKEINWTKPIDEWIYQFENDSHVLAKRWAMIELVKAYKENETNTEDKIRILRTFNKVLASNVYWRFKFIAIPQLQSLLNLSAPFAINTETERVLLQLIQESNPWVQTAAIALLGNTKDEKFADLYIKKVSDSSDRVINAAAIALGKTRSTKVFEILLKLKDQPSWKNQSLITTLYALQELKDIRGYEIALNALIDSSAGARWTLAVPVWDYRIAAANTLVSLGKTDVAQMKIEEKLSKAVEEDDINDIFNNLMILAILGHPRGTESFSSLKAKFKTDPNALQAVHSFETQYQQNLIK